MTTEPNENEVVPDAAAVAEPAPPAPVLSPGTMIRDARQAQRLSVDDLAAHTKLARATVEALERDDFGALLEPVYVRGYYRKCAKVLGVDEKTLIDAYSSRVAQRAPQPPAKLRLASGTELGSSSRLPMAMAVLFVIVAVIVCASLWWLRGATSKFDARQDLPSSISVAPSPSAPNAQTPLASDTPPAADVEGAAADNAMPPVPAAEPSAVPSADSAAAAASDANAAPATPAAAGSGRLQLVFNGASWVRINDASGKVLLDGLIAAGERRGLDGEPPFSLFIGKAPAVSVSFDGTTVDLQPYTRGNSTARLTLPATP
jgi:cytoskeleton protein RodZ